MTPGLEGKTIIVTVAQFIGSDGIVFVNHGNDIMFQYFFQRSPCIEKSSAHFSIVRRQQNLCGFYFMSAECLLIGMHKLHLASGSGGL